MRLSEHCREYSAVFGSFPVRANRPVEPISTEMLALGTTVDIIDLMDGVYKFLVPILSSRLCFGVCKRASEIGVTHVYGDEFHAVVEVDPCEELW